MPSRALPLEVDRAKFPPAARHLVFHSFHLPPGTFALKSWQADVRLATHFGRLSRWFAYRCKYDTWTRFIVTDHTPAYPRRPARARAVELIAAIERAPLAWIPAMNQIRRLLLRDLIKTHHSITRSLDKTGMSAAPIRREEIIEILTFISLT